MQRHPTLFVAPLQIPSFLSSAHKPPKAFHGICVHHHNPYERPITRRVVNKTNKRCLMQAGSPPSSSSSTSSPTSTLNAGANETSSPVSVLAVILFLVGAVTSVPVLVFMLLGHVLPNRARRNMILLKIWLQLTLFLSGVRVRAKGTKRTNVGRDTGRPVMIVSNRQSALDVAAIVAALPDPPRFIMPERAMRVPILGWVLRLAGCVALPTKDRRQAAERLAEEIGRVDCPLLVFPEGRPGPDGSVGKFLSQPFKAALAHSAQIVPVSVRGGRDMCANGVVPNRWGSISVTVHDLITGDANSKAAMSDKEATTLAFEVIKKGAESGDT